MRPRGGEKERSAARAMPDRLGEGGQGDSKRVNGGERVRTAKTVVSSHARARGEQEGSDSKDGGERRFVVEGEAREEAAAIQTKCPASVMCFTIDDGDDLK